MMLESEIQQLIQIEGPKHNCFLLRNNSGALEDKEGRVVRYGLGNISKEQNENFKSSDLITCMPVIITADMVGRTIGVFVAVEVKKENWKYSGVAREKAQLNFINWIRARGGIAFFCNSVDQFKREILKWKT